ncbi:hypothetical protein Trco_003922 [Trichoderma cornu-damae]|uniref:Secreted protein n=1 Tax=Trichoderma cornu-damae TaxID=654480 RepID=A0A9P8TWF4_9HYPO|nr:hypothetical protein Trco_003922 [Trichoderma cornu-damae]
MIAAAIAVAVVIIVVVVPESERRTCDDDSVAYVLCLPPRFVHIFLVARMLVHWMCFRPLSPDPRHNLLPGDCARPAHYAPPLSRIAVRRRPRRQQPGPEVNAQRRDDLLPLPLADHGVEVCGGAYPVFEGRPVLGVVDASRAVPQREVIQRPGSWVQPPSDAILCRIALPLVALVAVLDARVARPLEIAVPPRLRAARALHEGHEAADSDPGQVEDWVVGVVLVVDAVDAQLSAAVAGVAVAVGVGPAVVVPVLAAPLAVSAVRVDGPALDEAPAEHLVVDGPRLRQRQARGVGDEAAAAEARQVVGLATWHSVRIQRTTLPRGRGRFSNCRPLTVHAPSLQAFVRVHP